MTLLLLAGLVASPAQDAARVAGWRADLAWLAAEAARVHAGPSRPAQSPAFRDAVHRLAERVPSRTDEELVVEIQRLMAMLGDGHSVGYLLPTARAPLSMLPVDLYWFADGVYVVGGVGDGARHIGSRVLALEGQEVEAVLRRLESYISRDNAMGIRTFGPFYLTVPAFLRAVGVTGAGGRVTLTLRDRRGRTFDVGMAAGPLRRPWRKLAPPSEAPRPPPLYLTRLDAPFWLRGMPELGAVYVQFNQVANAPGESLARFAERMRDSAAASRALSLIVDVRRNNGGNNMLLQPLIDELVRFERGDRGRRVFVLTSRTTFSAAQNFINRLEQAADPIFAGEPSMSSPNFTGEDNEVVLPFSGVRVSISNRHWQDSDPADQRAWIEPQLPVALTAAAYFANADPVLDAVLQEIRGRRRRP